MESGGNETGKIPVFVEDYNALKDDEEADKCPGQINDIGNIKENSTHLHVKLPSRKERQNQQHQNQLHSVARWQNTQIPVFLETPWSPIATSETCENLLLQNRFYRLTGGRFYYQTHESGDDSDGPPRKRQQNCQQPSDRDSEFTLPLLHQYAISVRSTPIEINLDRLKNTTRKAPDENEVQKSIMHFHNQLVQSPNVWECCKDPAESIQRFLNTMARYPPLKHHLFFNPFAVLTMRIKDLKAHKYTLVDWGTFGFVFHAQHKDDSELTASGSALKVILLKKKDSYTWMPGEHDYMITLGNDKKYGQFFTKFYGLMVLTNPWCVVLCMEYACSTLDAFLKEKYELTEMTEELRIHLIRDLLCGVEGLQKYELLHCDLKWQNILVAKGKDGPALKIIDLGSIRKPRKVTSTFPRRIKGMTRQFIPPEIWHHDFLHRNSDMWAVGHVIYYIYTRRSLYKEVMDRHPCDDSFREPNILDDFQKQTHFFYTMAEKQVEMLEELTNNDPFSPLSRELVQGLIRINYDKRLDATEALALIETGENDKMEEEATNTQACELVQQKYAKGDHKAKDVGQPVISGEKSRFPGSTLQAGSTVQAGYGRKLQGDTTYRQSSSHGFNREEPMEYSVYKKKTITSGNHRTALAPTIASPTVATKCLEAGYGRSLEIDRPAGTQIKGNREQNIPATSVVVRSEAGYQRSKGKGHSLQKVDAAVENKSACCFWKKPAADRKDAAHGSYRHTPQPIEVFDETRRVDRSVRPKEYSQDSLASSGISSMTSPPPRSSSVTRKPVQTSEVALDLSRKRASTKQQIPTFRTGKEITTFRRQVPCTLIGRSEDVIHTVNVNNRIPASDPKNQTSLTPSSGYYSGSGISSGFVQIQGPGARSTKPAVFEDHKTG